MYYFEIALFLLGMVTLTIGYRKDNRNLMLAAAMVLFLSAGITSIVEGFSQGYVEGSGQA